MVHSILRRSPRIAALSQIISAKPTLSIPEPVEEPKPKPKAKPVLTPEQAAKREQRNAKSREKYRQWKIEENKSRRLTRYFFYSIIFPCLAAGIASIGYALYYIYTAFVVQSLYYVLIGTASAATGLGFLFITAFVTLFAAHGDHGTLLGPDHKV